MSIKKDNKMVNIYLIRHGETILNKEHKIAGQIETELTETGKNQAIQTALNLKKQGVSFDIILCSTLKRAKDTAKIISEHIKTSLMEIDDLKEINSGDFEGIALDKLHEICFNPPYKSGGFVFYNGQQLREMYNLMLPEYDDIAQPNGETKAQARERFMNAIKQFLDAHPQVQNLGVVAHGAVIRFTLLKICPETVKEKIKNAEFRIIKYEKEKGFFI